MYVAHITCQNHLTFSIIMNHHCQFPTPHPMPAVLNTLRQPAALDINTKSHISLILSHRDVLLTPQKKSFWPSVYPLLLIAAKNTSPIKTPNSLKSFHFQTSIQFPAVSWTQLNEPWRGISTVPVSDHGRQFCPLWCGRQLEGRVWWYWRQVSLPLPDSRLHASLIKKANQMSPKLTQEVGMRRCVKSCQKE